MKLITYESNGQIRTGALGTNDTSTMIDVTSAGTALQIATDAVARAKADALLASGAASEAVPASVLTPFAPHAIICIGLNYMDHCRETNSPVPTRPVIFGKFANSIVGPNDTVSWYGDASSEVDYEAELGVVIGKPCYRVSESDALSYIGGYTCVNDISARDIQLSDSGKQWILGKTFDGFCPIGPALVTADEIADPQALEIKCILNGQEVQHSNTREMIFNVAVLISHLSKFMTLNPGDLIATGTPFGVGMSRTPKLWLKDGDVVTVEIEKVGALTNTTRVL